MTVIDPGIQALLDVQDRDARLDKLRRQIESVPDEKKRIQQELETGQADIDAAKQQFMDIEMAIKKVEIDVGAEKEKILVLQGKTILVKKNEEYRALLKEVKFHEDKVRELEDGELEQWELLDEAKAERGRVEKRAAEAAVRAKAAEGDLELREKNCREQVAKVEAERQGLLAEVPEDAVRLYERLLVHQRSNGGAFRNVVAAVANDLCGSCHLSVTPHIKQQVLRHQLVTCEQCGAILYIS